VLSAVTVTYHVDSRSVKYENNQQVSIRKREIFFALRFLNILLQYYNNGFRADIIVEFHELPDQKTSHHCYIDDLSYRCLIGAEFVRVFFEFR
jgi:hypothetical protein